MELTSFAAHAAAFLLSVSLKTVLIFAVAGLVCLGLRRASAASRHLLWAVTLVSLLCLPVFCALLPPLAAPVLPAPVLTVPLQHRAVVGDRVLQAQTSITSPSRPATTPSTEANFVPAPAASRLPADDKAAANSVSPRVLSQKFNASEGKVAPTASTQPVPSLSESKPALSAAAPKLTGAEWLLSVWLIGMILVLSRTMLGLLGAVRLVRRSVAVASGPLAEAAEEAQRKMGLKTLPSVRDGSLVAVPMTFGILRPIVLVPEGAGDWPIERLQAVMLHEMGHIKRRDWVTAMLAEVVCASYWFHPLVWLAARQMRMESEQACDDLVLTSGIPPAEYADHLLEVVRGLTTRRGSVPAVVTIACKQDIAARIKTILATSKNRSAATGRSLAFATVAALTLVLPLAAMRPVVMHPVVRQHQGKAVQENAPWRVSLPDGTTARLISVTAGDPTVGQKPGSRTFTVGLSFPSAQIRKEAHVSLYASDDLARSSGIRKPIGDRDAQLEADYDFPPDQKQADLVLTVAEGPYRTLVTGTFQAGGSQRLATGESVTVSRAVPSLAPVGRENIAVVQVMVTVPLRFVSDPYESGLDVLGKDGQPLRIVHSSSNIPNPAQKTAHIFCNYRASELPPGGVSGFRFRCRLVHTFVFHHVGLQPRVLAAQTPLPTAPKPFDFDQTTWAQTAGDAALRLVAVSDKPSNAHRWWRPDGTPFLYNWHEFGPNFEPSHHLYPEAFLKQWPVLIFRTAHKTDTDLVVIDGWHDPRAFRAKSPGPAEFFCIDKGGYMASSTDLLAKTPQSFSVRLRVSAGPWQVQENDILAGTRSDALASWEVSPLSSSQTGVSLHLTKVSSFQQVRLVAFDAQNHEHYPATMTTSGNGYYQQFTLAMPLSQISKLSLETRPYFYRDFYGIARQPKKAAAPALLTALQQRQSRDQAVSLSNLHQIGLAVFHYAAAHDEHFPDAAHWMDQIIPYLVPATLMGAARQQRVNALFHDPASPPNQTWSYAYNRALSGLTSGEIDNPNMVVAVFESSRGVRNASDSGKSVPQPGRHSGGSDFLFADGHTNFLRAEDTPLLVAKSNPPVIDSSGNLTRLTQPQNTTGWFAPVNPESRQKIPIQGQVYDRRTMKPLSSTFVIFSQSPNKITAGSVWPSSFTNKAGRFQSILYPGKNYLMVLENNRFRLVGKTVSYEVNGNKVSVSTQGTKAGPPRSAQSDYILHWSLPNAYALKMSSAPNNDHGVDKVSFVPVARSLSR